VQLSNTNDVVKKISLNELFVFLEILKFRRVWRK